jgi:hypothetical protein
MIVSATTVIYFNATESDPYIDFFSEYYPASAGEALAIAMLFNHSFSENSLMLAGDTFTVETSVLEIARYLMSNPFAAENLFIKVLYDAINHINDGQSAGTSIISDDDLNLNLVSGGIENNLFMFTYFGRSTGGVRSKNIEFETSLGFCGSNQLAESIKYKISTFIQTTPIVFDLDGNGILDASNGVWLPHPDTWSTNVNLFDIDCDGIKEVMEWVGPNDGLLVNVSPQSVSELTGANLFGNGDGWGDGFQNFYTFSNSSNSFYLELLNSQVLL